MDKTTSDLDSAIDLVSAHVWRRREARDEEIAFLESGGRNVNKSPKVRELEAEYYGALIALGYVMGEAGMDVLIEGKVSGTLTQMRLEEWAKTNGKETG